MSKGVPQGGSSMAFDVGVGIFGAGYWGSKLIREYSAQQKKATSKFSGSVILLSRLFSPTEKNSQSMMGS